MTPPIRGLTELHPWAFAIARLNKCDENRSWRPQRQGGCIGMYLAIHGGKLPKGDKLDEAVEDVNWIGSNIDAIRAQLTPEQRDWINTAWLPEARRAPKYSDFFTPGIVAIARLAGVTTDSRSIWAVRGQYQWQLADVTPIEPIPYRGAQGLWAIDDYTVGLLRERWAQAHDGQVVF